RAGRSSTATPPSPPAAPSLDRVGGSAWPSCHADEAGWLTDRDHLPCGRERTVPHQVAVHSVDRLARDAVDLAREGRLEGAVQDVDLHLPAECLGGHVVRHDLRLPDIRVVDDDQVIVTGSETRDELAQASLLSLAHGPPIVGMGAVATKAAVRRDD